MSDRSFPLVYIAGPYRSRHEYEVFANIIAARKAAQEVWIVGGVPYCPHLNSAFMGGLVSDETFLCGDLAVVRRCDALMTFGDWDKSIGALSEVEEARKRSIPIFHSAEDLLHWLELRKREPA